MTAGAERVRAYRHRERALAAVREAIQEQQRVFRSAWVRDMVPSRDVAEMLDMLAERAEVNQH